MHDESATVAPSLECLIFRCGGELLGCETTQVSKVIHMPNIVPLPVTSGAVKGVFNYRGRILGVIDIRTLLGVDASVAPVWEWVVVLKGNDYQTGLLVDTVSGVELVAQSTLVPSPDTCPGFIPRMFMIDGESAALLAVTTLLTHPSVTVNQQQILRRGNVQ